MSLVLALTAAAGPSNYVEAGGGIVDNCIGAGLDVFAALDAGGGIVGNCLGGGADIFSATDAGGGIIDGCIGGGSDVFSGTSIPVGGGVFWPPRPAPYRPRTVLVAQPVIHRPVPYLARGGGALTLIGGGLDEFAMSTSDEFECELLLLEEV